MILRNITYVGFCLTAIFLLLQEHWLADGQLACLTSLSVDHIAVGISGFDDSDVLRGRPYGGCAIIWKNSLNLRVLPIDVNSRPVCAVLFESDDVTLLCICVCRMSLMPLVLRNFSFSCLSLILCCSRVLTVMFWLAATLMLISPATGIIL